MAGRTPPEAVQRFLDSLQRSLSCVTGAVLNPKGGYHPSEFPHPLTLGSGLPVELGGGSGLAMAVRQQYRIAERPSRHEPWKVTTVAYYYTLRESGGSEIISYQWHPNQRSAVTYPHLHLGAGAGDLRSGLTESHLPTGRVALEDFVRLLIEGFGARPLREDWEEVLEKSRAEFEKDRSW